MNHLIRVNVHLFQRFDRYINLISSKGVHVCSLEEKQRRSYKMLC